MTKAKSTSAAGKKSSGFTEEELGAMKTRARELKAEARADKNRAAGEQALLAKIAEMEQPDRGMAERIHAIVKATAPSLSAKTWYGQPAYANQDGKIICFFQARQKFGTRYATLGFNEDARLDDGAMWATAFALNEMTPTVEAKITELVKKAVK